MAKGLFKIYVGNLDYKVTEFAVRRLFEPYGAIEDIAMATDKETGKPRGFAIVMMRDHDEAKTAIDGVQGRRLMGRALVVNEAIKKKGSQKGSGSDSEDNYAIEEKLNVLSDVVVDKGITQAKKAIADSSIDEQSDAKPLS